MNVDEIREAAEQLAKEKEAYADSAIVKNPVPGMSADDESVRQQFLPSAEQHHQMASDFSEMLDTTKRAGAGGTKSNVVGIRPNGGKRASTFLEQFTGTGRMPKEKKLFEENVKLKEGKRLECPQLACCLYVQCVDCFKRVDRNACVPAIVPIPPGHLINPITREKWEQVGLRPGDVIGYLFCLRCAKHAAEQVQYLNRTGLDVVVNGTVVKAGQRWAKERSERISENVFRMIRNERANPESECFFGEAKLRG